jgi:hypothetical protein
METSDLLQNFQKIQFQKQAKLVTEIQLPILNVISTTKVNAQSCNMVYETIYMHNQHPLFRLWGRNDTLMTFHCITDGIFCTEQNHPLTFLHCHGEGNIYIKCPSV